MRDYGDALIRWGTSDHLASAADAYAYVLESYPESAPTLFRAGVAYRMMYDAFGGPDDFATAVDYWTRALAHNPNQYIWRRRIQQYGPRLDKPYPFYNWVQTAQDEIRRRGDFPIQLDATLTGAELAGPLRGNEQQSDAQQMDAEPDPQGMIIRDDGEPLVNVRTVAVPDTTLDREEQAGGPPKARAYRVFITLTPDQQKDAWWNNEAGGLALWLEPPPGYEIDQQLHTLQGPSNAEVSREARIIECEIRPIKTDGVPQLLPPTTEMYAYALYYICEHRDGVCNYMRQDFEIMIDHGPFRKDP
ncbi:MAG: hypothetical protein HND57_03745 [Planctomycetes bacterium]|nr:hypothetical protein [Planctomycetota bacterium]